MECTCSWQPEETMLTLLETFFESLIGDDDAVLVRKSHLAEKETGRDPHAEDKPTHLGQREPTIPKGDHHVFTHFRKDPNGEVCRMTTTTRARCKNRPLECADGTSPQTTLGELATADHHILNLDDRFHRTRRILIVGYTVNLRKSKAAPEIASCLKRFHEYSSSFRQEQRLRKGYSTGKKKEQRQRWFKVAYPTRSMK